MILKSYLIENNINNLDNFDSVLIYGENMGLKDDFKELIKVKYKDAEIINIFQDEIVKNNDLLFNELSNDSLFSDFKIILLQEISDKIFTKIENFLEKKIVNTKIFIFSNLLDKKSKLRNLFEKDKGLASIPCYQDNHISLSNYIKRSLKDFSGLTPEIINLIVENSGMERKIVKNELEKIKSLFLGKNIDLDNCRELLNFRYSSSFEEIRDATLTGNKIKVNKLIGEIEFIPDNTIFYLAQLASRISRLAELQNINKSKNNIDKTIEEYKPKIFWKDKPVFKDQMNKLSYIKLNNILQKVGEAEKLIKTSSFIRNDLLMKNLLLSICKEATTSS